MNFTIHNTKVTIDVLHADEILVNFIYKPRFMSWREMTEKERLDFIKRKHRWTIDIQVYGEEDRLGTYEVVVTTPIDFEGANDAFKYVLDATQEHWPGMVIKRILTTIKPGVIA